MNIAIINQSGAHKIDATSTQIISSARFHAGTRHGVATRLVAFLRKAVIAEIVHCASFTFNDGAKSKLIWSGKYFLYFMRPD
jgi:hypothetical protein